MAYPELSGWEISIQGENISKQFFLEKDKNYKSPNIIVEKNTIYVLSPENTIFSILATPITKNTNGQNIIFFKPAGFIYPHLKSPQWPQTNELTWENGFISSLMENLYNLKKSNTQYSNDELNNFISTFNWKKAAEIINNKIESNESPYNPWLLNKTNILEKISTKEFSSIYLNLSSVYTINKPEDKEVYLSSFILENINIQKTGKLLVKRNTPVIFYNTPSTGTLITYFSSKKSSIEDFYLPIYIKEL